MVIETISLSLLIGKLRGGKIKNIESLYIEGWYLFVLSFGLEIASLLIATRTNGKMSNIVEDKFFYIHIFIYLLLIIGLLMNYYNKGLRVTLLGSILNFLPLAFNHGRMPVSVNALKYSNLYSQLSLLEEGRIMTHALVTESTKLIFLSDIIPIPEPYIFPKIISIGDIFISLGLFILIQTYMKNRNHPIN